MPARVDSSDKIRPSWVMFGGEKDAQICSTRKSIAPGWSVYAIPACRSAAARCHSGASDGRWARMRATSSGVWRATTVSAAAASTRSWLALNGLGVPCVCDDAASADELEAGIVDIAIGAARSRRSRVDQRNRPNKTWSEGGPAVD